MSPSVSSSPYAAETVVRKPIAEVHPSLAPLTDMRFSGEPAAGIEAIAGGVEDIEIREHLNKPQRHDDRFVSALLFDEA